MVVKVGVRDLRSRLSYWLDRVEAGEEILVTRRGRPHVRIRPPGPSTLERLIEEGVVTPAKRPKRPIRLEDIPEVPGPGLSQIVIEQRRRGA